MQQVLFERGRDSRLARGGQTGQPDGGSFLLQQLGALSLRHGTYMLAHHRRVFEWRDELPSWKVILVAILRFCCVCLMLASVGTIAYAVTGYLVHAYTARLIIRDSPYSREVEKVGRSTSSHHLFHPKFPKPPLYITPIPTCPSSTFDNDHTPSRVHSVWPSIKEEAGTAGAMHRWTVKTAC